MGKLKVGDTVDWYGNRCEVMEIEVREAGFPNVRLRCSDGDEIWELAHQLEPWQGDNKKDMSDEN